MFRQYLLLVVLNQMASGLFRLIAGLSRDIVVASTFGSYAMLMLFALGGVVLSRGMQFPLSLSAQPNRCCPKRSSLTMFARTSLADNVKKWWKWGFWISPMMYGQNAIVVNEFLGRSWNKVTYRRAFSGPSLLRIAVDQLTCSDSLMQTVPGQTESLGMIVLKTRGFFTEAYWYWIGFGALFGFTLLFNFGFAVSLTFLNRKPFVILMVLRS